MFYCCYIIYSKSLHRYYTGYTSDLRERLELHNKGFFGGKSYTRKASDWEVYFEIPCDGIEQAVFIEAKIKKMKSRHYIENLKKYPELVEKVKESFDDHKPKKEF
jgi:putative endonuclease